MFAVLLSCLAFAAALPMCVLGFECLVAILPLRHVRRTEHGKRPSVAVLIPAHNEAAGIAATIEATLPQLDADDRLVVIADNCTDDTADVARRLGAIVYQRNEPDRRGKGYAIRFALDRLTSDPPDVVVCIDADCLPLPDCVESIAGAAYASGNPVQAAYTMHPPADASAVTHISAFAVLVKNYIRPRGLQRMRMPCLITGSGVAYPWPVLQKTPHPESHIVEDMHYSIELALAGFPTQPCMEAAVVSNLPDAPQAARTQRTRWEHGHLSVLLSQVPRLLIGALRKRSPRLLVLAFELMVPPLSLLLTVLLLFSGAMLALSVLSGIWLPVWILLAGFGLGLIGLTAAWWRFGRRVLPTGMLLRIPHYIVGKISIYRRFFSSPEQAWVPTARDAAVSTAVNAAAGPHFELSSAASKESTAAELP